MSVETETGTVSLFLPQDDVVERAGRKKIPVKLIDENQSFKSNV